MNQTPQTDTNTPDYYPAAKKAYSRTLLNLGLYLFIAIIAVTLFSILQNALNLEISKYIRSFFSMYCIAFPIYLLCSKPIEKTPPESRKLAFWKLLLIIPCCECLAIFGNLTGILFNAFFTLLIGKQTASTFLIEGAFGNESTLFSLIAVIIGPIIEEMLFRKTLLDRIRKYGDKTAMIVSGVAFGLFHGNFTQFFYAALLGTAFAFVYLKTGKITYTIFLHMFMNFWGVVIPQFVMSGSDITAIQNALMEIMQNPALAWDSSALEPILSQIDLLAYTAFNYLLVFTGLVILILNRKKIKVGAPIAPLPKGKAFSAVCLNFGGLAFIAICTFQFVNQIFHIL